MNYKDNLFYTVKLLFLITILVELAILKMIICPENLNQYISILVSFEIYLQHIYLSLLFLGGGALIFLIKV